MAKNWSVSLRYDPLTDQHNLAAWTEKPSGSYNALFINYQEMERGSPRIDNIDVDPSLLQAIMDELWKKGFRPLGFVGTEQVGAMRDNLEDLRHVTRSLLDKISPR